MARVDEDAERRDIATAEATTTFPDSPSLAQQVHIVAVLDLWATTDIAPAMALIEPARATRTGTAWFLISPGLPHARPALADPRGVCGYRVLRNTTS